MKVKVVIPCRNEQAYIGKCLDSLVHCNQTGVELQVWVVDGMSDDGTRTLVSEYAERYSFIKLVNNERRTTPYALNIGLEPLDYDIGIILGAHAVVDKDFVQHNVRVLLEHPEVGCAGGIIRNVHENEWSEIISLAMSSVFGVGNAHFRTGGKSGYVDTVAFGAYRKEVFERVGFFDEELARNQDDEFNFRVLKGGFKIYLNPSIQSDYYVRGSISKLYQQYDQYGYWKVFVNKKHGAVTTLRQLAPPLWVFFLLVGWTGVLIHSLFGWMYVAVVAMYVALAFYTASRMRVKSVLRFWMLLRTFGVLHFSYGLGYLRGVIHFYVLGRKPSMHSERLTR
jgi:cellulose synthase/poly-beta-1,6-N-acetylglucosamine synthase-like glycosyltransferase